MAKRTAQHPQLVLAEPVSRIADAANDARIDVSTALDVVDHLQADRVVEQAVDGEITALRIFFGRAEADGIRVSPVAVALVAAERGDFDLPRLAGPDHRDDAEGRADVAGPAGAEQVTYLFGPRVRRHIVVLRLLAPQLIPHATACPKRMEPPLAQPADHAQRELLGGGGVDGFDGFAGVGHV